MVNFLPTIRLAQLILKRKFPSVDKPLKKAFEKHKLQGLLRYSDRKPRACQKLGVGPRVGKCPAPGSTKFANAPSPGLTRRANASSSPGWVGGLGAAGFD